MGYALRRRVSSYEGLSPPRGSPIIDGTNCIKEVLAAREETKVEANAMVQVTARATPAASNSLFTLLWADISQRGAPAVIKEHIQTSQYKIYEAFIRRSYVKPAS
jgi:hypothetical protein